MFMRPASSLGPVGVLASVFLAPASADALAEPKSEWSSLAVLKDQQGAVWVLAFAPDGKTLAAASGGIDFPTKKKIPYSLRLWDTESQKPSRTLVEDGAQILGMAFTSDGKQLVTAGFDGQLRRLDVARGKEVERVRFAEHSPAVWFSPDRKLVLLPVVNEVKPGQHVPPIEYQVREIDTGKQIEPAKPFPRAQVLALAPEAKSVIINVHLPPDPRVKLPPMVSGLAGRDVAQLWDATTGEKSPALTKGRIGSAFYSPDGRLVLLGSHDAATSRTALVFWDVAGKKLRPERIPQGKGLRHFVFADDSSLLAAASDDRTIRLWETAQMKEIAVLKGHTGIAQALAWSPDGKTLASVQGDGIIRLWKRASR
jgi:WD40 repeat protein